MSPRRSRDLLQPNRTAKVNAGHDRNTLPGLEVEEVVIIRDNEVRLALGGAFKNAVIVRIGLNCLDRPARIYDSIRFDSSVLVWVFSSTRLPAPLFSLETGSVSIRIISSGSRTKAFYVRAR